MNLAQKQVTYYKPSQVSTAINEGVRALAETYQGKIQRATDHCMEHVPYLTQSRLDRIKGDDPPAYTRDGQVFISLIWVLLVDGMVPHRPRERVRTWLVDLIDATDLLEVPLTVDTLSLLIDICCQSVQLEMESSTADTIRTTLTHLFAEESHMPHANNGAHKKEESAFITALMRALQSHKGYSAQTIAAAFNTPIPAFLGIHAQINAIALVEADGLSRSQISTLHDDFYAYLHRWRPASPLKRLASKQGIMCFIFANGCTRSDVDFIIGQVTATENQHPVITDGARVVSWAVDLSTRAVHGRKFVLPSWLPMHADPYPGQRWLRQFLNEYAT